MPAEKKKNTRPRNVSPRRPGTGYDEEAVYHYFVLAGGNVRKAMRMAEEAGDGKAPRDPHTWSKCIERKKYRERYEREQKEEWMQLHRQVNMRKQFMLDQVAAAIEPLIEMYGGMLSKALEALMKKENYEIAILRKDFAFGPETFDKMCRLYMRAVGEPERITSSREATRPVTVMTIDEAEEQKRLSRENKISRPMPQKDLAAAKALMATIDLGPEWTDTEKVLVHP